MFTKILGLVFAFAIFGVSAALADPTPTPAPTPAAMTRIDCRSFNYTISIEKLENKKSTSTSGFATVTDRASSDKGNGQVEKIYVTERVIAALIKVNKAEDKFELSVIQVPGSPSDYSGRILVGKSMQSATCVRAPMAINRF